MSIRLFRGRVAVCIGVLWLQVVAWGACRAAAEELQVFRGDFEHRFLMTGALVAEDAVALIAPNVNIWPLTVRWLAEDGAEVPQGDVVVEFDNSQLTTNLDGLERAVVNAASKLVSIRAAVRSEELEAQLALARTEAELEKARLDAEVPENLLSAQEFEKAQLAHERAGLRFEQAQDALKLKQRSIASRIEQQRLELAAAERAAERAREGIKRLTLRAPRAGIVLVSDNGEEGRPYQSGDTVWPGQIVARLPDLSSMIVEAQYFDVDDGKIAAEMPVIAVIDAFPGNELKGEILEVGGVADELHRGSLRRAFNTRIRLQGLDLERMRPGMSVKVVVVDQRLDLQLVPRAALGWSESEEGGSVVARRENGELRAVEIGPCTREACVLVAGLELGARLSRYRSSNESGGVP